MPALKPVSGHTALGRAREYLTKNGRALAVDLFNLDAPRAERAGRGAAYDWAAAMDATREEYGTNAPWNGRPARTYKHYMISPDPRDGIDLETLRRLATEWAGRHFGDHEVAIVYHDDNKGRIPHAHVIVNNVNLATGRRLQDPSPRALKRSLQAIAADLGLSHFEDAPAATARPRPRTMQRDHRSRAESEIESEGGYSWMADIRNRVGIAMTAARSEAEFKSLLAAMGVDVADNSPKARRADWIYSLSDAPARRVSGEKLGLDYCKESVTRRFAGGAVRLGDMTEREIARIAREAVAVGDLGELRMLGDAVRLCEQRGLRSVAEMESEAAREPDGDEARLLAEAARFASEKGLLPAKAAPPKPGGGKAARDRGAQAGAWRRQAEGAQGRRRRDDPDKARRRGERGEGNGR